MQLDTSFDFLPKAQTLSTITFDFLPKESGTVNTSFDFSAIRTATTSFDFLSVDTDGSFRGVMTTDERDALDPLFTGDSVVNIEDSEQPHHRWNGSTWIAAEKHMGSVHQGKERVFSLPTQGTWRVDLANRQYPIRYWNGTTTRFSVDASGNVSTTGNITAASVDIPGVGQQGIHIDGSTGNMSIGGYSAVFTGLTVEEQLAIDSSSFGADAILVYDSSQSSQDSNRAWIEGLGTIGTREIFGVKPLYSDTSYYSTLGYSSLSFGDGTGNGQDIALERTASAILTIYDIRHSTGITLELKERTAPSAGGTNTVRIWAEDDGGGKTRVMALFNTGAAQQIAIQP